MQSSERDRAHVGIIRDLFAACEALGLKVWLLGGWGIDALLGKMTREHHDVDLITRSASRDALRKAVREFADQIGEDCPLMLRFGRLGLRVDTRFFYRLTDGTLVSDLDASDPCVYPWPPGSFPEEPNGWLQGSRCRAISWEAQYVAKEGFSCIKEGKPLRPKDEADLIVIRQHVAEARLTELKRYFPGIPRGQQAFKPGLG